MARVSLQEVSQIYRTSGGETIRAIDRVNLDVGDGEFVCLVGKSGCGKTTLLRIVAGLDAPSAGSVWVNGKPVRKPNPFVGVVFQEDRLFPWRTVRRNVELGLEIGGKLKQTRQEIVDHYLQLVGLKDFADVLPHELSGGMKQRASIARALVNGPGVLLMDEPFGALDAQTRNQMQGEMLKLWERTKCTVIFVTHSVDEAVILADRVVVLSSRPAHVENEFKIVLKQPRDRTSQEVTEFRRQILAMLDKT